MDEKQLIQEYLDQKTKVEEIDALLKEEKETLSFISDKLINYLSDRGQIKTGTYEGLGSIAIRSFNTYKVEEHNKDQLMQFLKENNLEGVIRQTIHHKTLDKICNELIEEGKPLPEYINSYNVTTVQLNKG